MDTLIEEIIHKSFIEKGLTLSCAESCTGGALAARLTRLPGCSAYFLGSIVAYSNDLKTSVLGVGPSLLQSVGAVSAETVRQMAIGVLGLTHSDYSLAVSGIAGPGGGSVQKPVGTIWAAVGQKGQEPYVWNFYLTGQREEIIQDCVNQLLHQLWLLIKN